MDPTKLFDSYDTDGSGNAVTLNITIGYAQTGSTSLTLSNNPFTTAAADVNGNFPDSFSVDLGTNTGLKGQTLTISTTVTRIQPTASSSLTIELDGGAADKIYPALTGTIANAGDPLFYYSEITFN